jgi:thymidine kinase
MFAGKSSAVVRHASLAVRAEGIRTLVIKPAFDTRYGEARVATHDGLWVPALAVASWPEIPEAIELVIIDECQFMCPPAFDGDLIAGVKALLSRGTHVIAAGLDADWHGDAFDVTARLMAMADTVTKLRAVCAVCGERNATKNHKKVRNGKVVELGASDMYEARCPEHWTAPGQS